MKRWVGTIPLGAHEHIPEKNCGDVEIENDDAEKAGERVCTRTQPQGCCGFQDVDLPEGLSRIL